MAIFYLIRHGKPDYTYGDTHGFIGQGHDYTYIYSFTKR